MLGDFKPLGRTILDVPEDTVRAGSFDRAVRTEICHLVPAPPGEPEADHEIYIYGNKVIVHPPTRPSTRPPTCTHARRPARMDARVRACAPPGF